MSVGGSTAGGGRRGQYKNALAPAGNMRPRHGAPVTMTAPRGRDVPPDEDSASLTGEDRLAR
jgi:hypothetical protein